MKKRIPKMNGADLRLKVIQEKIEDLETRLTDASNKLQPTKEALDEIDDVRDELEQLIHSLRDLRTLTQPENWKLLAYNDLAFLEELLRGIDENVLAVVLQNGGRALIKKLLAAVERAKTE